MVTGKADSFEPLEGMSPDVLWQTSRHHRRLRAGHVHTGVARELERTANSSWESNRTSTANRFNKRPGVCRYSHSLHASDRRTRTETGACGGIGKRVTSEATREGEAVVLADHSTEGRASGREGGEARPKRPTGGKVKPGITCCRKEK